ncbi:MAG: DUF421 domain-containing protein [Pseudobdellovibrionaceae bacterium]
MFDLDVPVWELVFRVVVIYFFVLAGLRLSGKKQIGEMAPFDLVVLLILSETVQNAMTDGENSLLGGMILAGSLLAINHLVAAVTFKSKMLEELADGKPQILIHQGKVDHRVAKREKITHDEILETLRGKNIFNILDVEYAILETNGTLSVKKTQKAEKKNQDQQDSPETIDRAT